MGLNLSNRSTLEFPQIRLVLSRLGCVRGGRRVLEGIEAIVEPGRVILVSGPNGSGKSTLLRLAAGLLSPDAGEVRIEGSGEQPIGELIHFIGHLDAVKDRLSVRENLAFWRQMLGGREATETALAKLGLAGLADMPGEFLSAGQRRRLALARLAVAHRPLWLLDEPMTALDEASGRLFGELLQNHLARGGLAVIASHVELPLACAYRLQLGTPSHG